MTDNGSQQAAGVTVPDDIRMRFPKIVDLIVRSESMNAGERQYWINILPVMTPEQQRSLEEILLNERKQLEAIDKKYAHAFQELEERKSLETVAQEREGKAKERKEREEKNAGADQGTADDLLRQIEDA